MKIDNEVMLILFRHCACVIRVYTLIGEVCFGVKKRPSEEQKFSAILVGSDEGKV